MVASIFLLIILGLMIFFIPPSSWLIVFLFIGIISLICFLLLKLIVRKKLAALVSLLTAGVAVMLSLGAFDIINFALIVSLFIGILILIR